MIRGKTRETGDGKEVEAGVQGPGQEAGGDVPDARVEMGSGEVRR